MWKQNKNKSAACIRGASHWDHKQTCSGPFTLSISTSTPVSTLTDTGRKPCVLITWWSLPNLFVSGMAVNMTIHQSEGGGVICYPLWFGKKRFIITRASGSSHSRSPGMVFALIFSLTWFILGKTMDGKCYIKQLSGKINWLWGGRCTFPSLWKCFVLPTCVIRCFCD